MSMPMITPTGEYSWPEIQGIEALVCHTDVRCQRFAGEAPVFPYQHGAEFERRLINTGNFEILAPRLFSLLCFRYQSGGQSGRGTNLTV